MNYDLLEKILDDYVVTLEFTKINGEKRKIVATRNKKVLSSYEGHTFLKFRPPHLGPQYDYRAKGNIVVWDVEKNDWRTIKAANVLDILEFMKPNDFISHLKSVFHPSFFDKIKWRLKGMFGFNKR